MNEQVEQRMRRVQQNAQIALERRMAERENVIITRLVATYNGGKFDPITFVAGIAAIAELRSIAGEAKRDTITTDSTLNSMMGMQNG